MKLGDIMENKTDFMNAFLIELKRGTLTLAVLSQLKYPEYGYSLLEKLLQQNLPMESSTLYPLLRRLEKQGILDSEWDTTETRPRKYYKRSAFGDEIYHALVREWMQTVRIMDDIIEEEKR